MSLMKKDMGGAADGAHVRGSSMMAADLPVRLRVLAAHRREQRLMGTPSGRATCSPSRQGMTVEIGNTDAEGSAGACGRARFGQTPKGPMRSSPSPL